MGQEKSQKDKSGISRSEQETNNINMEKNKDTPIEQERISEYKEPDNKKINYEVMIVKDIQYSSYIFEGSKEKLLFDLYLPKKESSETCPLLIYIHGGGWLEGSKEWCPGEDVSKLGYAMASINYRLSDVAIFPAQIYDIKEAVRWLRKNASKYGIDPNRFGVWGDSAGGHLSALLGTTAVVQKLEGEETTYNVSSEVQAVCDWFGPTDFTQVPPAFEEKFNESIFEKYGDKPWFEYTQAVTKLLGGPVSENLKLADLANPINFVNSTDPPFLIYHGELDNIVPISQSELLADKLKENNVNVTFIRDPNRGHSYSIEGTDEESFDPVLINKALNFFDSVFKYSR